MMVNSVTNGGYLPTMDLGSCPGICLRTAIQNAELRPKDTLDGEPKPKITNALSPELNIDLSLDDVSTKWRDAENASMTFDASQVRRYYHYFRIKWKLSSVIF